MKKVTLFLDKSLELLEGALTHSLEYTAALKFFGELVVLGATNERFLSSEMTSIFQTDEELLGLVLAFNGATRVEVCLTMRSTRSNYQRAHRAYGAILLQFRAYRKSQKESFHDFDLCFARVADKEHGSKAVVALNTPAGLEAIGRADLDW